MRVEIAEGFPSSFSLDRIVVTDGPRLNTFHGLFSFGA